MKRVVIVGAGPAGSAAAIQLARFNKVETILLEREVFPRTKVCGSGLSPWTLGLLDHIGVGWKIRRHAYRIDGAILCGKDKDALELRGDHETAVLLREKFDHLLAEEAALRGADLREGTKVSGITRHEGKVIGIETSEGAIEADAIIDASGARGGFNRMDNQLEHTLHTMLAWYEGVADTSDVVELFFDATVKPHYGWVFPESDHRVNIGIVFKPEPGTPNAKERFDAFLDRRLAHRLRHATQIGKRRGHPAHVSNWPRKSLVEDGLLIAGEAGNLVDPATAEGIYHALWSGTTAASVVGSLLNRGKAPTAKALSSYDRKTKMHLGPRLALGRSLVGVLRTPVLDTALSMGSSKTTRTVLTRAFTGLYHG